MKLSKLSLVLLTGSIFSVSAYAQTAATEVQRNVNQQERIQNGLESGALNTREAAKLERDQSQVNRMQSKALQDGNLSAKESARINQAQNRASRDIAREKHDAQTGNPNSASSQRMQADVQRNVNQQTRIGQGIQSGQLSNREVGNLQRGQARVTGAEARAGADGSVGAHEQARIHNKEDRQSRHIYQKKHNANSPG